MKLKIILKEVSKALIVFTLAGIIWGAHYRAELVDLRVQLIDMEEWVDHYKHHFLKQRVETIKLIEYIDWLKFHNDKILKQYWMIKDKHYTMK